MGQVDDRHAALGVVRVLSCAELEQQLVHIVHYICATVKDNSTGLYAYIYRTLCINEQKYRPMTLSLCVQPLTPIYTGSLSRQCNQKFGHAAGFPPRNGLKSLIGIILRTGEKTHNKNAVTRTIILPSCQSTEVIQNNTTTTILSVHWRYPTQYYSYPVSLVEVYQTLPLLSCQSAGGIPTLLWSISLLEVSQSTGTKISDGTTIC